LAGLRIPPLGPVPGDDAVAVLEDAQPRERPLAELTGQRLDRPPAPPQRYPLFEQRACRAQKHEVEEVEAQATLAVTLRRHQPGADALPQAARRQADDARGLRGVEACLGLRASPP